MTLVNPPAPGITDARLLDVVEVIDRGYLEVASFDVFDTLLWRKVYEPVDAFLLLGEELRTAGIIRADVTPEVFAILRQAAEKKARDEHPDQKAPEVTLEQIYEEMSPGLFGGRGPVEMASIETTFEMRVTFVDLEIAAVVRLAADRGLRVALVSDTYFSPDQLRALVDRPQFDGIDFDVFTSSAHQTGKGQKLFDVVLRTLGASPEKVLHIGDHPESDVAAPARFGIPAVHYHKYPGTLAHALDREIGVREGHVYGKRPRVDLVHGDFGLSALRAKAMTQYPAGGVEDDVRPYWQFGASILGPVFSGYAEWVHRRASEEGASEVYCLMREGEFLSRLLNRAADRLGSSVVAKPVWASRRVCAEASILRADKDELIHFVARRKVPTVRDFCRSIGLDARDVPGFTARGELRLDHEPVRTELIMTIVGSDDLRERVLTWSAEKRKRFLAQLHRDVDLSTGQVILADLGWGATIQGYIENALKGEGLTTSTLGLYLVTASSAVPRMLDGIHVEGFLASAGHPEPLAKWVTRSPEILEQVCMNDEGSLIGFDDDGTTLHAAPMGNEQQTRERCAVQKGVLFFDDFWGRYASELAPDPVLGGPAAPTLEAILLRLVVEPMPSEAALLAGWDHDENFGSESSETIVTEEAGRFAEHMTPTQFLNLPMTRVYWPFGLAALRHSPLALAAGAVAAEKVGAGAFESATGVPVILELSEGGGFSEFRRLDARSNVNGLRFVRTEFLEPTRAVRVIFGEGAGAVRLDGLRFACVLEDGQTWIADIPGALGFHQLSIDRGVRLAPNVVLGTHAGPAVTFRIPETMPLAYRVELDAAFAILPIPPADDLRAVAQELLQKAARRTKRWVSTGLTRRRSTPRA